MPDIEVHLVDEFDSSPDWSDVERMEALTTADGWPAGWVPFNAFLAELSRRDFWTGNLATLSERGRRDWLDKVFGGCRTGHLTAMWERLHGGYQHHTRITDPIDHQRLANEYTRRMNERFGVGEPLPFPDVA